MTNVRNWFDERFDLTKLAWLGLRIVPKGVGWWYTFGSATLIVFILLVLTGMFLMMNYSNSPDHAYESVQYISNQVQFGSLIRSIHHWSAYAMMTLITLHTLRVFFFAAYRYPREIAWMVGVVLLLLVAGMSFTGYLLPWDQRAYWATTVGTHLAGETPLIGPWLKELLVGGPEIGAVTLTRFFTLHVMILPSLLVILITLHIFLVIQQGISAPPNSTAIPKADRYKL